MEAVELGPALTSSRRHAGQVAAALVLLAGCGPTDPAPKHTSVPPDRRPLPPLSPLDQALATKVTAEEIYRVYSRNLAIGALPDQRFLNHALLVTGTKQGMASTVSGASYMELRGGDVNGFTYAEPATEAFAFLASLPVGTKVRLLCRGDGELAGSPILRECIWAEDRLR